MRTFVAAKLHGIVVRDKSVKYHGSVAVGRDLMEASGMKPFERVDVVNLTTGARWTTYILPDDRPGWFSLNGGGARLGELGDECVLMTYVQAEVFAGALAVHCHGPKNAILDTIHYQG
jgi:aspartate 1-decarboxylase